MNWLEVGRKGEQYAVDYLKQNNFSITDRNYRKKWGEIDIVACKSGAIHFVEVKTVKRVNYQSGKDDAYLPEDNIHPQKLKRLFRAIETYLLEKRVGEEVDWQLDAILIYVDGEGVLRDIELVEDIC
jgi:putative endonuclease